MNAVEQFDMTVIISRRRGADREDFVMVIFLCGEDKALHTWELI